MPAVSSIPTAQEDVTMPQAAQQEKVAFDLSQRQRIYSFPAKVQNCEKQAAEDAMTLCVTPEKDLQKLSAEKTISPEAKKLLDEGKVVKPVFSQQEFELRLEKLRNLMKEKNLSATILTSMHCIKYFTNFLYCSFGRPYACIVTEKSISLFTAGIDNLAPRRNVVGNVTNYIYTDWNKQNFLEALKQDLESNCCGADFANIGVEKDHMNMKMYGEIQEYMFAANDAKKAKVDSGNGLKRSLAAEVPQFVDVSQDLMRQRLVKSQEEIKLIKKACEVANCGSDALIQNLVEGRKEWQVAEKGVSAMNNMISNEFPQTEMRDTWVWFQAGINTDGAHNALTSKPLQNGDLLSFNLFPMIDGYYVALERTAFFGDNITDEHLKYWKINVEVFEKGIEMIKPGVVLKDIAKELNKIYEKHGVLQYRTFGYGHSFGVLCHYYGRETVMEIREDNETVLEPGMVISMEPMITIPEHMAGAGGYREHDILLVTESGNENITNYKYGPEHMIFNPKGDKKFW